MLVQNNKIEKRRIVLFLTFVFSIYFIFGILMYVTPDKISEMIFSIFRFPIVFMGTPIMAVLITKKITKDKSKLKISLNIFRKPKFLLFSSIVPTIAILCGFIIFYTLYPSDIDYNGTYISQAFSSFGAPKNITFNFKSIISMYATIFIISIIAVPSWLISIGEDLGWQGYLLPLLCNRIGVKKAVLLTGFLWGVGHAPLIFFGMNYGDSYLGAPYTGIGMMIFLCIIISIWMSFVFIKTQNCMYASIIHGSINIVGETGIFISLNTKDALLGPNSTGIIGMLFLLIGAIILFLKLPKEYNIQTK